MITCGEYEPPIVRVEEFCRVSLETSHNVFGRDVSNVNVSTSGGVREREKETSDGCAVKNADTYVYKYYTKHYMKLG